VAGSGKRLCLAVESHRAAGRRTAGAACRDRRKSRSHQGAILRHAEHARMTTLLQPGFAEPVAGAQACFRAVLDAMARPGCIRRAGIDLSPPSPLAPATAAVLLTL